MQLTTKGSYALRAMIDLALHDDQTEPVSRREISARQRISTHYLAQLLGKLREAGLVTSIQGPKGGYSLARNPGQISIGDIFRAVEEAVVRPRSCVKSPEDGCPGGHHCVTRLFWKALSDRMMTTLDTISLKDLADQADALGWIH